MRIRTSGFISAVRLFLREQHTGFSVRCGPNRPVQAPRRGDFRSAPPRTERLVGADVTACTTRTVKRVGGNPERDLAALAHELQPFRPTSMTRFSGNSASLSASSGAPLISTNLLLAHHLLLLFERFWKIEVSNTLPSRVSGIVHLHHPSRGILGHHQKRRRLR